MLDLCVDFGLQRGDPPLLLPVFDLKALEGISPHYELVDSGGAGSDDIADHLPGHHRLLDIRRVDEADPGAYQSIHVGVDGMDLDVGLDPGELGVAVGDLGLESVEVRRNGG